MDKPDLLHGEGGAAGGHHVAYPELMHHDHVDIALDQDALVLTGYLRLGEPDAEQVAALDVDFRLRGVDVLRRIVRTQGTAAERHHPAADRVYGEHDALPELVGESAVVIAHRESGIHQVFRLVAGRDGGVGEDGTPSGGPSEAEFLYRGVLYAPRTEIRVADITPFPRSKLSVEEFLGIFRNQKQALLLLAAHEFLGILRLLDYLYVVLPREIAQGLGVGAVLLLHHEADGRPGLSAAEALVDTFCRGDIERRSLLVVERAAGDIIRPAAPERHIIADHIHYLGGVEYEVDCLLRYHDATSHRNLMRTRRTSFS